MNASFFKNVRGWVFDLDGVLVLSEPLHMAAWTEVFRCHGMHLDERWYQLGIGMVDSRFYACIAQDYGLDPQATCYLEEKQRVFLDIVESRLPLVDGINELLESLRGKMRLAVATASSREFLDFVLLNKGWQQTFDLTLSRNEITHPKPHPEIYQQAALRLGLQPEQCIAVEDSPTGLASATQAGLKTIGITTNFSKEALAAADHVIDSYEELQNEIT